MKFQVYLVLTRVWPINVTDAPLLLNLHLRLRRLQDLKQKEERDFYFGLDPSPATFSLSMICRHCLHRTRTFKVPFSHFLSTTSTTNAQVTTAPRGPPSGSHEGPPAATSTFAAQPFSTPSTPAISVSPPKCPQNVKSSVPAGTPLKGLGYYKGRDPPVAMEDHEYPDWLWSLLDQEKSRSSKEKKEGDGDIYGTSKQPCLHSSESSLTAALQQNPRNSVELP